MGKRTGYPPGTFSWVDLATPDAGAAKAFYSGVFAWEMEDGDGDGYSMCRLGGDAVAGLLSMPERTSPGAAPPSWTSYVTVADADAAAERAAALGGHVVEGPFDVADAGRAAVLEDPQGAGFAVWQPRGRIGAERVNDVGCLCMNELATSDLDGARRFYEALFGWTMELEDTGPGGPTMGFARNGAAITASFFPAEEGLPAHWRPCFTVASTETAVERVRELGGTEYLEPLELPDGSIAMVRDPQGARFTLFAGETDP
jgi:predicted enzyme related to lactoylglutathione lyase